MDHNLSKIKYYLVKIAPTMYSATNYSMQELWNVQKLTLSEIDLMDPLNSNLLLLLSNLIH